MITTTRNRYRGILSQLRIIFSVVIVGAIMLLLSAGCSSGPAAPSNEKITKFLAKHISMSDESLADYYVDEEKPGILASVRSSVLMKKEKGVFESVKNAVYDFSGVDIKVAGQKEEYVNDQPTRFLKVNVKGDYMVSKGSESEVFKEDEEIIFQAVGGEWKVTEKVNPWK